VCVLRAFEMKCLRRISNVKRQQTIKNEDIIKRTGTSINIVHRMMERKQNFFGHICWMQDDRLIKQVVFFCIMDGTTKEEDIKEDGRSLYSELVQQGYLHLVRIGNWQDKVDSFRDTCCVSE